MIKTILWDLDNTLLDFDIAERNAIKSLFEKYNLGPCTDSMLKEYDKINKAYWKKFEKKEVDKKLGLVQRYVDFFNVYNLDNSIASCFNDEYQLALGDTIIYLDDSYNIVKSLKGKVRQYLVSNGTTVAQRNKLKKSKFGELFDDVFLSDEIGFEKPSTEFFDFVFDKIGLVDKSEVIIVGDSISSDIQGGENAGIKTVWYNPKGKGHNERPRVDYDIRDLREVYKILGLE